MVGQRFVGKSKMRTTRREDLEASLPTDEAEFDPTLQRVDGSMPTRRLSAKEEQDEEEKLQRKLSKRRKQKKHKHQKKGFDVVAEEEVKFTDKMDQHFSLKGSIDHELDGVNTIHDKHVQYKLRLLEKQKKEEERKNAATGSAKRSREESQEVDVVKPLSKKAKKKAEAKQKKEKTEKTSDKSAYLKNEVNAAMNILSMMATKAETWATTRVIKEAAKTDFLDDKQKIRDERKAKRKAVELKVLAEVKKKAKEDKKFRKEMAKEKN